MCVCVDSRTNEIITGRLQCQLATHARLCFSSLCLSLSRAQQIQLNSDGGFPFSAPASGTFCQQFIGGVRHAGYIDHQLWRWRSQQRRHRWSVHRRSVEFDICVWCIFVSDENNKIAPILIVIPSVRRHDLILIVSKRKFNVRVPSHVHIKYVFEVRIIKSETYFYIKTFHHPDCVSKLIRFCGYID